MLYCEENRIEDLYGYFFTMIYIDIFIFIYKISTENQGSVLSILNIEHAGNVFKVIKRQFFV